MTTFSLPFTGEEIKAKLEKIDDLGVPEVSNGLIIEDNKIALNDTFYNYLLKNTFAQPAITSFSLNPTTSSFVVGETFVLTSISHTESNIGSIVGNLTLKRGSTTLKSDIAPQDTSTSVTVSDSVTGATNGTHTWTLSGSYKDPVSGAATTFSKTDSISFYWPVYYFASSSETPNVSGQSYQISSSVKGTKSIDTTSTNKYVHFITTEKINKITSGGFDVSFDTSTLSITINNCTQTYNTYTIGPVSVAGTNTFVLS